MPDGEMEDTASWYEKNLQFHRLVLIEIVRIKFNNFIKFIFFILKKILVS